VHTVRRLHSAQCTNCMQCSAVYGVYCILYAVSSAQRLCTAHTCYGTLCTVHSVPAGKCRRPMRSHFLGAALGSSRKLLESPLLASSRWRRARFYCRLINCFVSTCARESAKAAQLAAPAHLEAPKSEWPPLGLFRPIGSPNSTEGWLAGSSLALRPSGPKFIHFLRPPQ